MFSVLDSTIRLSNETCAVSLIRQKKRAIFVVESSIDQDIDIITVEFRKTNAEDNTVFLSEENNDTKPLPGHVFLKKISAKVGKKAIYGENQIEGSASVYSWEISTDVANSLLQNFQKQSHSFTPYISINCVQENGIECNGSTLEQWTEGNLRLIFASLPREGDPIFCSIKYSAYNPLNRIKTNQINNQLVNAVISGNKRQVEESIYAGADIDHKISSWLNWSSSIFRHNYNNENDGMTPLTLAVSNNNFDILKQLVVLNADIDLPATKKNESSALTAMDYAIRNSNIAIVKYLYCRDARHTLSLSRFFQEEQSSPKAVTDVYDMKIDINALHHQTVGMEEVDHKQQLNIIQAHSKTISRMTQNTADDSVVRDLIQNLRDEDVGVQQSVAKALGKPGETDEAIVQALTQNPRDEYIEVRQSAIQTLEKPGSASVAIVNVVGLTIPAIFIAAFLSPNKTSVLGFKVTAELLSISVAVISMILIGDLVVCALVRRGIFCNPKAGTDDNHMLLSGHATNNANQASGNNSHMAL